jgi:hypothetical protein
MKRLKPIVLAAAALLAACGTEPTASVRAPDEPRLGTSSTLSASIYGPSAVQTGATCTWEPVPSGGTPPYSYSWNSSQGDWGTDYLFDATAPTGPVSGYFYINLTVWDANLDDVSVRKKVTYSPATPTCGA